MVQVDEALVHQAGHAGAGGVAYKTSEINALQVAGATARRVLVLEERLDAMVVDEGGGLAGAGRLGGGRAEVRRARLGGAPAQAAGQQESPESADEPHVLRPPLVASATT
ncbi:MAG: hypothetical protein R3F43_04820 [bacterium]